MDKLFRGVGNFGIHHVTFHRTNRRNSRRVGLGGGIIIVPLLIGLHSLSPQLAVGTSMVTVVFTGLSSTLTYMKHKRVDYKSGLILFIGSGPGGIIGSWANKF